MKKFYTNHIRILVRINLPHIITAMRKQIEDCGGEFLFEKKVVDFKIDKNKIRISKNCRWR